MKKLTALVLAIMMMAGVVSALAEDTLLWATNAEFPPYEMVEGGEVVGIDADIAAAIAEKLGMKVDVENMEFDSIISSVKGGKVDMALAGMTVTDERLEEVNFTSTYATGVQVIIVKEGSPLTSPDQLNAPGANHTVGVQLSTTGDMFATWNIEDEGLGTVDRYAKGADAVMALKNGKVDCVIIDNEPAKVFVSENEGLKILETAYVTEEYAIAIAKENVDLYNKVENALQEMLKDGTVQAILDKWIKAE
ncbi:MAG: transporter substrate-binding domain-containing protein [Clostridia bacterium]|nr:transporter substrate-binding domain-containing protein [Clostridia bacterium]